MEHKGPRSIEQALGDISRWQDDRLSVRRAELESLLVEIGDLRGQLAEMESRRDELDVLTGTMAGESATRSYGAIFDVLTEQSVALSARSEQATTLEARRLVRLANELRTGDDGDLFRDYQRFPPDVLARLPPSYRTVLEAHHTRLEALLRGTMNALEAPFEEFPALMLDVVFSVDAPLEAPELVMVVAPIHHHTLELWTSTGDNLQTSFAGRAIQALYRAATTLRTPTVQAMYGAHRGLLAIELELPPDREGDTIKQVELALNQAFDDALELVGAQIHVKATYVPVEFLLPPDAMVEEIPDDT